MKRLKGNTKLKNLKLTSVDMVRRGANPDAYINLYKSAEGTPTPAENEVEGVSKSMMDKIIDTVKSALGFEVEKKADTFEEKIQQQEIRDNRWKYVDALNMSIDSIICDEDLSDEQKLAMVEKSIAQFAKVYTANCQQIISKTTSAPERTGDATDVGKSLDDKILDAGGKTPTDVNFETKTSTLESDINKTANNNKESKEGEEEMKIDKSRFTPEELQSYEKLIAKGMVDEGNNLDAAADNAEIKKTLDAALAEMEELKKSAEMKELTEVAKKYAVLGKKEDELAQTLYTMKKSSPEIYESYVAVLDQSLGMVEKSGMFEEIGKSSRGMAGGDAQAKINNAASEIQKADPTLSRVQAVAKAWEQHPELVAEYEKEYKN